MAGPIESLSQQLIRSATDPFKIAILTGIASSSFCFFGNLGLSLDGPVPATMTVSERARKGISDTSALNLWQWMYNRAKVRFIATGVLGGVSYLVASAFRPDLQRILYGASFFTIVIIPYTVAVLIPINNTLNKVTGEASRHDGKGPDPGVVDKLLGEWMKYNSIRVSISAVGWALGMAVFLLA